MKHVEPPSCLSWILLQLLADKDRECVAGDLYEEYCHQRSTKQSGFAADLWYAQQVLSFVPRRLSGMLAQPVALTLLCVFTGLASVWLGGMDLYLRHPGYLGREWIAGTIAGQALLTLIALRFRGHKIVRRVALVGCLPIEFLAGKAFLGVWTGANFEGYILLISLALTAQTVFTWCTLWQPRSVSAYKSMRRSF